tara:strand:- start:107 stop:847 length:741 start_codon:yes stop_codon:yes gene_type:complete
MSEDINPPQRKSIFKNAKRVEENKKFRARQAVVDKKFAAREENAKRVKDARSRRSQEIGIETAQKRWGGTINALTGDLVTPKQNLFVEAYCATLDFTAAKDYAGYGKKTKAKDIMANPNVIRAIDRRQAISRRKLKVTEAEIITGLLEEAKDKDNGSPGSRVTAWTQLGRHLAMFTDKKEIDATLSIENVIADLPDLDDEVIEHEEDNYHLFDDMEYGDDQVELSNESSFFDREAVDPDELDLEDR